MPKNKKQKSFEIRANGKRSSNPSTHQDDTLDRVADALNFDRNQEFRIVLYRANS